MKYKHPLYAFFLDDQSLYEDLGAELLHSPSAAPNKRYTFNITYSCVINYKYKGGTFVVFPTNIW